MNFANVIYQALVLASVGWTTVVVPLSADAAERTNASTASEQLPENQKESDWVDNRWSRVEVGPFLSSSVPLVNGTVLKGLSIRVGGAGQGTVCYDTKSVTLRGAWTGGFIQFDPARYGLIRMPKPYGEVQFLGPTNAAWGEADVRYLGFHLSGNRVVLAATVDGVPVLESPWLESHGGGEVFTRTIEVGPSQKSLTLCLFEGTKTKTAIEMIDGAPVALLRRGNNTTAAMMTGDSRTNGTRLEAREDGRALVAFDPSAVSRRCKVFLWHGRTSELSTFIEAMSKNPSPLSPPEDLEVLSRPGPGRWQPLTTRGRVGFGADPYVIDTLAVPYDNPWKGLFFTSGVDFLPNGDAAVCTIHGDVWLVSGIDAKLQRLAWRRFATGLFQPLGLKVVDGRVHVLGRDQITALHDKNDDGEADFYENFSNLIDTSAGGHDYVTSLETDESGNFYYVDPKGVHRIRKDGRSRDTIATGCRNPNGLGVRPDGKVITVAPQEGEWTPASSICEALPEAYYGYGGPKVTPQRPQGYDAPLCWLPHRIDNSGGSQIWVTSDRWGPLRGQLLHLSYGRCAMMLCLREVVDEQPQGGVVPLKGRFLSGVMRGAFRPQDGQLYLVGSRGWQTSALQDGCLQRVRYTGSKVYLPTALHAHGNGLIIAFTEPLRKDTAEDIGSFGIQQWAYRYQASYGSKEYSVASPKTEGHDPVEIKSARLLADGRSVFLEIPRLQPVMQMEIKYNLNSVDGKPVRGEIYNTVNRLGPAWAVEGVQR